jgi:hypothetical protein
MGLFLVLIPGLIVLIYSMYDAYITAGKMNAGTRIFSRCSELAISFNMPVLNDFCDIPRISEFNLKSLPGIEFLLTPRFDSRRKP